MHCIFCDEMRRQTPNVFMQGEHWVARLDMVPLAYSHTEIVPRRHVESFCHLTPEELGEMAIFTRMVMDYLTIVNPRRAYEAMQKLEPPCALSRQMIADVLDSFPSHGWVPEGWIIEIADGPLAGQSVPHLHQHIIPITPEMVRERGLDLRYHVRRFFPDDKYVKSMLQQ